MEVLKRFGMDKSNSVHNPIVPGCKLMKDEDGINMDKTYYKQVVGSLNYLTATRLDIMFVVNLISRYVENPTKLHLQAPKRILRYLKGTIGLEIFYRKGEDDDFVAYTHSDYAGDLDEKKSNSGYVFLLSSGAVSWSSKKLLGYGACYLFIVWSTVIHSKAISSKVISGKSIYGK